MGITWEIKDVGRFWNKVLREKVNILLPQPQKKIANEYIKHVGTFARNL